MIALTHSTLHKILFYGAPLALLAGLAASWDLNQALPLRVELNRDSMEQECRSFASKQKIDLQGWSMSVFPQLDRNLNWYFEHEGQQPQVRLAEKMVARITAEMSLVRADGQHWLRCRFLADGRMAGYRIGGNLRPQAASSGDPVRFQAMAEERIRALVPAGLEFELGQPEVQKIGSSLDPGARRYLWRANLPKVSGLDVNLVAEVEGDRLVRLEATPQIEEEYTARVIEPYMTKLRAANILRLILLVLVVLYGCYRYARRRLEREAPQGRTWAIILGVVLFGVLLTIVEPRLMTAALDPERTVGSFRIMAVAMFLGSIAVQGLLLGLCYGALEGDLREAFPGSLTSTDTVLTGRLFSQNACRSVLAGLAVASWAVLIRALVLLATGAGGQIYFSSALNFTFANHPGVVFLLNQPLVCFIGTVAGLGLPLTFAKRNIRSRGLALAVILVSSFMLGHIGTALEMSDITNNVTNATIAMVLVCAFLSWDFLTAVAALVSFTFLMDLPYLASLSSSWRAAADALGILTAITLGIAALGAWRGRRFEDAEVRPTYARNLAARLSMRAELNAAREAQLRLLPERPPEIPGLQIAASCTPSAEVGGDYYDFFALAGNRVGITVAEGGNDGLASALTIALAKGALLCEVERAEHPEQAIQNVLSMLGNLLTRPSGTTSLLYAIVDPGARTISVARTGSFPHLILLSMEGRVTVLEDGLTNLAARDSLVFFTDGLPKQLAAQGRGATTEEMLRRLTDSSNQVSAQRLHDQLLEVLLPKAGGDAGSRSLPDDLTTVVVHIAPSEAGQLERVA